MKADQADADAAKKSVIASHIDVFAVHQPVARATLHIEVISESRPDDYLVVISRRQQTLYGNGLPPLPDSHRAEVKVPSLSQMVQPSQQRNRTCSPTTLSMLMSYYGKPYHPAFVDQCKEPQSGLYGVWPLNLMQASRRGFVGAVELVCDWQTVTNVPQPFVASIRFEKDQLTGAPLEQTAGHLVLVRGTTASKVLCSDPAAPTAASVTREYDLSQFSKAWLGFRGATYILALAEDAMTEKERTL